MIQSAHLFFSRKTAREALAIAFLAGFWLYFCRHIFGGFFEQIYRMEIEVDNIGQLWLSWWIENYFSTPAASLFHTPFFNAPNGAEVLTYDVAFVNLLISGLLRPVLGMFGSLNGIFVVSLLLGLVGTYVLIRQVNDSPVFSAALAAIPLLFVTRQGAGFVDVDLANYGFAAFAAAFWIVLLRKDGRVRTILCGVLVGLTCIAHMYHGINVLMLLGMGALASLAGLEPLDDIPDRSWKRTLGAMAVGVVVSFPFLLPSITSLASVSFRERLPWFPHQEVGFLTNEREYLALLALVPLVLLAIFWGRRSREIRFGSLATAVFCLFAAGTHMPLVGPHRFLPLPFLFFKNYLPFFWRYNFTDRFGRMAILMLVFVIGSIARRIARRYDLRWWKMAPIHGVLWIGVFFLSPIMIGLTPRGAGDLQPIPMDTAIAGHIDKAGALFAGRKADEHAVVVDLFCEDIKSYSMLFQLAHEMPVAGDPLRPDGLYDPERDSELTRMKSRLCRAAEEGQDLRLPEIDQWRNQNVRFLLLPKVYLDKVDSHFLTDWETRYGPAVVSDAFARLYDLNTP